ncbi:hypothetical protein QF037_002395 [Streptomyces canus]|nr:hypothetical protein [Streptomyces canus]
MSTTPVRTRAPVGSALRTISAIIHRGPARGSIADGKQ